MYFTFIIPAYNSEKYIKRCVESIINSGLISYEILIIDDESTDSTLRISMELQTQYEGIVSVFSQKNQGPNIARMRGVTNAKGEYTFFCDSDDSYDEDALKGISHIVLESRADIVEFGYKMVFDNNREISYSFPKTTLSNSNSILRKFLEQNCTTNYLWNKCFKTSILKDITYHKLFAGEDTCDLIQIYSKANLYVYIPQIAYLYYQSENSLCRSSFSEKKLDEILADRIKLNYISSYGKEFEQYIRIQGMAHCALLYSALASSEIENKEGIMEKIYDDYLFFRIKLYFFSEAYWRASIKRKTSIFVFSISPRLYCKIVKL